MQPRGGYHWACECLSRLGGEVKPKQACKGFGIPDKGAMCHRERRLHSVEHIEEEYNAYIIVGDALEIGTKTWLGKWWSAPM